MHIFDLTKEIRLAKNLQKKYDIARIALHVFYSLVMLFVAYRILFPIVPLDFTLDTPNSSKNTLVSPRISETGEFPPKKLIGANMELLFNANPIGHFSKANISLALAKNANNIENTIIKFHKSYRAFFYPTGKPADFKNGTLATTPDGKYYIVSNNVLRKFSNTDIILKLGYPKSAFVEMSMDDLKLNNAGDDIVDDSSYPDYTLFAIDDVYYELKNQQLYPFVSARAFLSQFDASNAIAKNIDFLSRYPVLNSYLGFADGTLVSSADSVYILSENKSYPVENEVTFLAMGFSFDDVIPVTTNELSAYEKQKQFTNDAPHPSGIIFFDQKTNTNYIIKDGEKHPINSAALLKTYSKQKTILVDSQQAKEESSCILKKNLLSSNTYSCNISLEHLDPLIGNDYEVSSVFSKSATLGNINVTFSTPMTFNSLRNSLSTIKNKLKNR